MSVESPQRGRSPAKNRCEDTNSSTRNMAPKVPPLPKLHSRGPLVTTELSKPIFRSTMGHDFDLSRPIEDEPFCREYNPLHDPHTRAFFHRPTMCRKLQQNGFVTGDMQVVCSLREYNAYREFMECESMKMRKKLEEKTEKEKQALEKGVVEQKVDNTLDKKREAKRHKFFQDQEKKLALKQRQMRQLQQREEQERLKTAEEKKLMRERNEIRREAEREQRWLTKLQQEHQQAVEKRRQLKSSENQIRVRMLHLQHTQQSHRLQKIKELEGKWQAYDDHVQRVREEEEKEKTRLKQEKEKKRMRRMRVVALMKAKKEARWKEQHEQSCQAVEQLKKQADNHEKLWQEKKEHEVKAWREKIHHEQTTWVQHINHQLEASHNQHQQEMEDIFNHSFLPKCAKTTTGTGGESGLPSPAKWAASAGAGTNRSTSRDPEVRGPHLSHHRKSILSTTSSRGGQKSPSVSSVTNGSSWSRRKSVRFQEMASIHVIEEDELDSTTEPSPSSSLPSTSCSNPSSPLPTSPIDEVEPVEVDTTDSKPHDHEDDNNDWSEEKVEKKEEDRSKSEDWRKRRINSVLNPLADMAWN